MDRNASGVDCFSSKNLLFGIIRKIFDPEGKVLLILCGKEGRSFFFD